METASQQEPEKGNLSLLHRIYGNFVRRTSTVQSQREKILEPGDAVKMVDTASEQRLATESREAEEEVASSSERDDIVAVEKPSSKRPTPRDVYDPDNVNAEDQQATSPPKRVRRTRKVAQNPIVQARTSRGSITYNLRKPKGSDTVQVNGQASERVTLGQMESDEAQSTTRKKWGRERPKSNGTAIKSLEHLESDAAVQDNTHVQTDDAIDGLTSILMNPSPIKPPHNPSRETKTRSQPRAKATRVQLPDVSDDEIEERNEKGNVNGNTEVDLEADDLQREEDISDGDDSVEGNPENTILLNATGAQVKIQDLVAMHQIANHVGCAEDNGEWTWVRDARNTEEIRSKLLTREGKRVQRRIKSLAASYEKLYKAKGKPTYQETLGNHVDIITNLGEEIEKLVRTRLNNVGAENKTSCLYDIYYNLIPGLLGAIVACASMKDNQESIMDEHLQDLTKLVEMSWRLAESAGQQAKKQQHRSAKYEIASPTQQVTPLLRRLFKKLRRESATREEAQREVADQRRIEAERKKKSRERKKRMAEKERILLLDEERGRLERIKEQEEIRRKQRMVFNNKLQDPVFRRLYSRELERIENLNARREVSADPPRNTEADEDDLSDDSFADDPSPHQNNGDSEAEQEVEDESGNGNDEEDNEERLHVFGNNNLNNPGQTRPFSDDEVQMFIDIMKVEHGNQEKHQVAAEELERSLDEIFILAKDFQETMNACHENGQFCDDEWTYDIWMAPNSDPS